ncbi:MAG: YHS domain-containing (seleno)protein [Spirochaeta sp.]|jgi:YHS domain-containing protein|nr:YHS domain-containing (seleno)protein [Spirochaeta sp.]
MQKVLVMSVFFLVPVVVVLGAGQQEGPVNTTDGIAIEGYDPVAYHTMDAPVEGSATFTTDWDGATWYFVSAEHRDLFTDDPERYAPHYGGYCAQAAAQDQVAPGDPELWTIEGGRLFLNYNARYQRQFRSDLPENIAAADRNWPGLRAGLIEAAE